jgi:hypothetical protein
VDEKTFIARAQAGDREALGQLLLVHRDACYAFALRLARRPEDAEDVCQESFARAAVRLPAYGPEYDAPENLERLRKRGLAGKRSLALREFALGVESLERFVRREPLRRTHECVFGVLAMESEPVDPRL